MNIEKQYQSEQLMVCHQDAEALFQIGAISEAEMRKFDRDCLVQKPKLAYETEDSIETKYASPATV